MNRIFFARHGQSKANLEHVIAPLDSPLTELGRDQALELARKLESLKITKIVSSPFLRANQTAEIIAQHLGITDVEIIKELEERNLGTLTNQKADMVSNFYDQIIIDNESAIESQEALIDRMQICLKKLKAIAESADGDILAAGHSISGYYLQQVSLGRVQPLDLVGLVEIENGDYIEITPGVDARL